MRHYSVGKAFPMGATPMGSNAVQFVSKNTGRKDAGLVLYEKKTGRKETILFRQEHRIGNVYSLLIEGINPDKYTYNFLEDGREQLDPYAKIIFGNEAWGKEGALLTAGIGLGEFSWEGDQPLHQSFEESIVYQLHVRGFTRHPSSQVKNKGTFEGIEEKIPYLKELGVTALELLPAYEFQEQEKQPPMESEVMSMEYMKENYCVNRQDREGTKKLNYWGFKEGSYFAPKASYAAGKQPDISFKQLVKKLHQAEIEVIMQFYFLPTVNYVFLLEVLRFWRLEYHVDGFRLLGVGIPIELLAVDPVLCNSKLLYEHFDGRKAYGETYCPVYRNVAVYNDEYMYAIRHFLKGDVGALGKAFEAMLFESRLMGKVSYLTNYNSFTLMDMVSYDRKHNEENGEGGRDGNNYNVSWNCGVEGPSRKKSIAALRKKQMKNALTLLMCSKGTPVLLAGDEFGNSQGGNNNPYCQDNSISWLNWKDLTRNKEQFCFTKDIIRLRKEFPLLRKRVEEKNKKGKVEYPYLSYHGEEAWKLNWDDSNEEAGGILFYSEQTYLYLCINMYWQERTLALPNLPGKGEWILLVDTSGEEVPGPIAGRSKSVMLRPRSIKLITAKGSKSDFDESLSAF